MRHFVVIQNLFQCALIADIGFDAVHLIFNIPHEREIHAIVQENRTQTFLHQQSGSDRAVHSHAAGDEHFHK